MITIEGRVRPFGRGTPPAEVRLEWPETLDEVEDVLADRYSNGEPAQGLLADGARKALIRVQDEIRNSEYWDENYDFGDEDVEAPPEDDPVWQEVQELVQEMVDEILLEVEDFPQIGPRGKKESALDKARKDPEAASALIAQLQEQHGLK